MIEISTIQRDAIDKVAAWMKSRHQPVFRLAGYAGTGKTTLARIIAERTPGTVFCAYSGKAAQVLQAKGIPATTIHSLIYAVEDERVDEKTNEVDLSFTLKQKSKARSARLIVVDEASMVDDQTAADLMRFDKPILAMGDPFQLPPVKGSGSLMSGEPDVLLEEIHRQAADNPIIALSMKIRAGTFFPRVGDFGPLQVRRFGALKRSDLAAYDAVICGRNSTRVRMSRELRAYHGFVDPMPMVGEILICTKSSKERKVTNGETFKVVKARPVNDRGIPCYHIVATSLHSGADVDVKVPTLFFEGKESSLHVDDRKTYVNMTFANAITCHKAQGSQWPAVAVINEAAAFRRDDADHSAQWLYTAVTRAAERLLLVV